MAWTAVLTVFVFRVRKRRSLAVIAFLYLIGGFLVPLFLGVDALPRGDEEHQKLLYVVFILSWRLVELELMGGRRIFKAAWETAET